MWTADWFRRVGEASARDCVMMSYSAARVVKDAMGEAGWTWRRIPGSGKKRDWLRAEWRAS
jgi:tRNA 5-methylaminomethyl-2-thiouridine biosynthesis bifunctional protein